MEPLRPVSSSSGRSAGNSASLSSAEKGVNIKVIVRCRPQNASEKGQASSVVLGSASREVSVNQIQNGKQLSKKFTFDDVFGPTSTQKEVFDSAIAGVVDEVLQGFNCTVFAYGQTGTGKTYTMEGERDEQRWVMKQDGDGVIPRAVRRIFETLENNNAEFNVRVSFLELYNEELSDLISGTPASETGKSISGLSLNPMGAGASAINGGEGERKLKIFEDPTGRRGQVVQGLEEVCVTSVEDVMQILEKSSQKRRVAETQMNKHSSRSHTVFSIMIHIKEMTSDGEELLKIGKLNLVDLAGSECIGKSGALNQRAKEAGMINQSLLTLGRVITALVDHTPHIPYRESKLTRLLQDSLGGKTKTCIVATISPSALALEETLSTLDYANRAKNIKNKPEVNQKMTKKTLIREYSQEIATLTAMLTAAREKNGVYLPPEKYDEMQTTIANQSASIEQFEKDLLKKTSEFEILQSLFTEKETELVREKSEHSETRNTLTTTKTELDSTKVELAETIEVVKDNEAIITERTHVESSLLNVGQQTIGELKSATSDIAGLFAKIDRKENIALHNTQACKDFHEAATASLGYLGESLERFAENSRCTSTDLAQAVSAFAKAEVDEISRIRAKVESMMTETSQDGAVVMETARAGAKNTSAQITGLVQDITTRATTVNQTVTTARADINETLGQVRGFLDTHNQRLTQLCALVAQNADTQNASVDAFQQETAAAIGGISARVAKMVQDQVAFLGEQSTKVTNMADVITESSKAIEKRAVEEFTKLMSSLVQQQLAQLTADTAAIKTAAAEQVQVISAAQEEIATETDKLSASVGVWTGKHKEITESGAAETLAFRAPINATTVSIAQNVAQIEQVTVVLGDAIEDQSNMLVANVDTRAADIVSGIDATVFGVTDQFSVLERKAQESTESLTSGLKSLAYEHVAKNSTEIQDRINGMQADCMEQFVVHQGDELSVLQGKCDSFVRDSLQVEVPTGSTPVKKQFNVPVTPLPKTREHREIIAQRREVAGVAPPAVQSAAEPVVEEAKENTQAAPVSAKAAELATATPVRTSGIPVRGKMAVKN